MDLAIGPEMASSILFPKIFGPKMANEILLLGKKLNAQEAEKYNLVNKLFKTGDECLE